MVLRYVHCNYWFIFSFAAVFVYRYNFRTFPCDFVSLVAVYSHASWTLSFDLPIFGISLTSWSLNVWVLDPSVHVIWLSSCDSFLTILHFRSYTSKLVLNYLYILYYLLVRVPSSQLPPTWKILCPHKSTLFKLLFVKISWIF